MNNFLYFVTCLYQYLVDNVLKIFVCSVLGLSFFIYMYLYLFLFWVRVFLVCMASLKTDFLATGAVPEFQ